MSDILERPDNPCLSNGKALFFQGMGTSTNFTVNTISHDAPASVWAATWMALFPGLLVIVFVIGIVFLLPAIQTRVLGIKPVMLSGIITVCLGGLIFSQTYFSSTDSYSYVNPFALFWLKYGFGVGAAVVIGFKQFLSTDYAKHLQSVDEAAPPPPGTEIHKETTQTVQTTVEKPAPAVPVVPLTALPPTQPATETKP
jgi:hypothetical protein